MTMTSQRGVTLLEVLITVLVLSTALMALAALQTRSLQYNSSAYLRSQANIIAYDVFDRMRIATGPTGAVMQNVDIDDLVSALPGGEGDVQCSNRECTVTISWTEPTANQAGDESEQTTFAYTSRI